VRRSEKPVTPSDFSMDSRRFSLEGSRADTIGAPRERVYVDIRTYEEDVRMVKRRRTMKFYLAPIPVISGFA